MKISVINATQMNYQDVQDVIRAVNRQLQEDFRKYWHKDVELVLEGWTGADPDPDSPFEIRGEAILYLWDQEDVENALGYHALTNLGVPFSFVFTELSKKLGEEWSVTLSHEVLELAVDPEINLLVQGPHPDPDEGGRAVSHWYELCDAVQAQTYEIDDVEVSNFVLPLYFTEGEEHTNHNDFLGLGVKSFGVAPGGYVGFYDPLTDDHEQFLFQECPTKKKASMECMDSDHRKETADQLKNAKERKKEKDKYQGGGRSTRRGAGGELNNTARVYCDSIFFVTKSVLSEKQLVALITNSLGPKWIWDSIRKYQCEYDAIYTGDRRLGFSQAWQLVHELEKLDGVAWAEPSLIAPIAGETDLPDNALAVRMSNLSSTDDLPGTENHLWAFDQFKVQQAWDFIEAAGKKPGKNVVIGHPDSGFLPHKELDDSRVNKRIDCDFLDHDDDAQTTKGKNGKHGLATASVIMSGIGAPDDKVRGPARESTIVPLRVTKPGFLRPTPVLFIGGMRRLRKAIDYAAEKGCQVISMSLGGLPSRGVRRAIKRATDRGTIVLAAAGNVVKFVVWPARYPESIAVAGSNIKKELWSGSSCGSAVDITAGGESMWRASFKDNKPIVGRGNGTSYAVAFTAGAAALWRSFYDEQLKKVRPEDIQELFRAALKKSASTDHKLLKAKSGKSQKFGAGLLDCEELLKQAPATLSIGVRSKKRGAVREFFKEDMGISIPSMNDSLEHEFEMATALQEILSRTDSLRSITRASGIKLRKSSIRLQVSPQLRRVL